MPTFVGILNLTQDSFSDGGRYLSLEAALAHGEAMLEAGADWLDLGAESSNPEGARVSAELELARLRPVLEHFARRGARLSVDTHKPEVMRAALELGATMINDIRALAAPGGLDALAARPEARVVLMYARQEGYRALLDAAAEPPEALEATLLRFFEGRLAALRLAGIDPSRALLDPGMGYFVGPTPEHSVAALRALRPLRALGCPVYVSVSRKSFLGALLGGRPPAGRAHGTLGAELWALAHGADFVRTHDPGALRDAWTLWRALERP